MGSKVAKTPTIFQMEATECGAASLGMVMAYHGRYIQLDRLRNDTGVSRDGCKASKILQGARKHGCDTEGRRMGLDSLLKAEVPCIIHWNFNHFVVFEGVRNGHAYINDPAVGRRKLTIQELDEAYTGIVLFVRKGSDFEKTKKADRLYPLIKERLAGQGASLIYLIITGVCLIFPGILVPIFSQIFVDEILLKGKTNWLPALMTAMASTAAFQFLYTLYRDKILLLLQAKVGLLSSYSFLHHLMRLPLSFYDQRYTGDISERVENNDNVCNFIVGDLINNILNVIVSLFYIVILYIYSPILTLIGLISFGVNFLIIKVISKQIANSVMKLQQDQGKMVGVLMSGINIISTLKAAGIENVFASRVMGYYAKQTRMEQKYGQLQQIINAVPSAISSIGNIVVLMAGGCLVINGQMSTGMLVAYNSLLGCFIAPMNELIGFVEKIQKNKAEMSRVDDVLRYKEDEKYQVASREVLLGDKLEGRVTFENVSFGYSKVEKPMIEDFNFQLECGKSVAFIGASGCGKSTIVKLASGLYFPWSGEIKLDGSSIKSIPEEVMNNSVSTVSQEIFLFSGTIKENITMWNKNIREEDLIQAAKDACIHDFIVKCPGAYDAVLTEGGRNLSGGQRQRIEIARALVTNPTVLIMDEATSALDAITEKQIVDNIKKRGCTCIIVAHRLSAIRDCDEILVMEKGHIVQRGTHEQLKELAGHYQRLINNM